MVVVSVEGNELEQIAVERGASSHQLDLVGRRVTVVVDGHDADARLAIELHEAAATDVEEHLANLRKDDGEDRAVAVRLRGFADGTAWHLGVEKVGNQKNFGGQII